MKNTPINVAQRLLNHAYTRYKPETIEPFFDSSEKLNAQRDFVFGELSINALQVPKTNADTKLNFFALASDGRGELQSQSTEIHRKLVPESKNKEISNEKINNYIEYYACASLISIGSNWGYNPLSPPSIDLMIFNQLLTQLNMPKMHRTANVSALDASKQNPFVQSLLNTDLSEMIENTKDVSASFFLFSLLKIIDEAERQINDNNDINEDYQKIFVFMVSSAFLTVIGMPGLMLFVSVLPPRFKRLVPELIGSLMDPEFINNAVFANQGNYTSVTHAYAVRIAPIKSTTEEQLEHLFGNNGETAMSLYSLSKSLSNFDLDITSTTNRKMFEVVEHYISDFLKPFKKDWITSNSLDIFTTALLNLRGHKSKIHLVNDEEFLEAVENLTDVLDLTKEHLLAAQKDFYTNSKEMTKLIEKQDFANLALISLELEKNKTSVSSMLESTRDNLKLFQMFVVDSIESTELPTEIDASPSSSSIDSVEIERLKTEVLELKKRNHRYETNKNETYASGTRTAIEYIPQSLLTVLFDKCTNESVYQAILDTYKYVRFADGLNKQFNKLISADSKKILKVLICICQDYYGCIMGGEADAIAKNLLPRYKAKESEATIASKSLMKLRQFTFDKQKIEMLQHCTLISTSGTIQIYFRIIDSEMCIGYIGPHLQTAGD